MGDEYGGAVTKVPPLLSAPDVKGIHGNVIIDFTISAVLSCDAPTLCARHALPLNINRIHRARVLDAKKGATRGESEGSKWRGSPREKESAPLVV